MAAKPDLGQGSASRRTNTKKQPYCCNAEGWAYPEPDEVLGPFDIGVVVVDQDARETVAPGRGPRGGRSLGNADPGRSPLAMLTAMSTQYGARAYGWGAPAAQEAPAGFLQGWAHVEPSGSVP